MLCLYYSQCNKDGDLNHKVFQVLLLQLQNLGERYVLTLANNLFIQQGFELQQVSYLYLLTPVALTSSFPVTVSLAVVPLVYFGALDVLLGATSLGAGGKDTGVSAFNSFV